MLDKFKGERSIHAIYHLLKGKRSSQTIQDGFLYQVHGFFGLFTTLRRDEFDRLVTFLNNKSLIKEINSNQSKLSSKGQQILAEYKTIYTLPKGLDGWYLGDVAQQLWLRLSLLVQTLSQLIHQENKFIPIVNDSEATKWIKAYFHHTRYNRQALSAELLKELNKLCITLSEPEANVLIYKLSGRGTTGLTWEQLATSMDKDVSEIILLFHSGLHQVYKIIVNRSMDFPVLSACIEHKKELTLTKSTYQTKYLLDQGYSLDVIAKRRGLKVTTIQDHIVEIAFHDLNFSIAPFVSDEKIKMISDALKKISSRRLSAIKEVLDEDVDYFQIRLVLTKERSE